MRLLPNDLIIGDWRADDEWRIPFQWNHIPDTLTEKSDRSGLSAWRLTSGTVVVTMTCGLLAGKISLPNSRAGYHGRDRILPTQQGKK